MAENRSELLVVVADEFSYPVSDEAPINAAR